MFSPWISTIPTALFLAVLALISWYIVWQSKKGGGRRGEDTLTDSLATEKTLPASDILKMEFEYARTTASEAMNDRHTIVNYYLIIVGILASGVLVVLENADLPSFLGTTLLWILCIIGLMYLLTIIRLRGAWHDSALAMNQIKDYYIAHSKDLPADSLKTAFRWRSFGLPAPDKKWTVFYYSICLIGLLDAVAYTAGGFLLIDMANDPPLFPAVVIHVVLAVLFFALHTRLYTSMLKK